jgi:hypothetical protein
MQEIEKSCGEKKKCPYLEYSLSEEQKSHREKKKENIKKK